MDLMDEELRRVLAGTAEPTRRREEVPPTAAELAAASRPSFRMSSPGRRAPEQRGGGEAIDAITAGFLSSIPAGLAGIGNLLTLQGPQKAAEAVQRVQDALALDPETEGGVRAIRGISEAFSPLGVIPQAAGEATLRATGSPLLATGAELLADPLNLLGAGAAARPAARGVAAAGRGAAKAGKATVQSLGPKAAEMAEAYMRRAGMMPDIFIGKSAKTWDAASNVRAVEMEKAGADPRDIWRETGNWRAPDGMWRQEISDAPTTVGRSANTVTPQDIAQNEADKKRLQKLGDQVIRTGNRIDSAKGEKKQKLIDEFMQLRTEENALADRMWVFKVAQEKQNEGKVRDLVQGPILQAYPELGEFTLKDEPPFGQLGGYYDRRNKRVAVQAPEDKRKQVFVHEGQHHVQSQEGFSPGNVPEDSSLAAYQKYLRGMGEAEARATEKRIPLSDEERRALFPEESYDVPISELFDERNLPPRRREVFSVPGPWSNVNRMTNDQVEQEIRSLMPRVTQAYESGNAELAQRLDDRLERLMDSLESRYVELEEDMLTKVDMANPMMQSFARQGEMGDAETDMVRELADRWKELNTPGGLYSKENPAEFIRAALNDFDLSRHGGLKENVSDQQFIDAAKDAYEAVYGKRGKQAQSNERRLPQADTQAPKEVSGGAPLIRSEVQSQAKALGLPAAGSTDEIARLVKIAQSNPSNWTKEDFDLIAPHLSVHQDLRPGAKTRVDSILSQGLSKGMVDSVGDMASGQRWTWGKSLQGTPAYVFISGGLKYQGQGNPRLAPGNKPLFAIEPGKGQNFYEALQTARQSQKKAQGGLVGGTMSYTQAADVIANKLVGQGVDPDRAMTMALRMSDAHMKAGGAVLMSGGGSAPERPGRMRKTWDGPLPNRPVVNGRAMVSAEELADFRRQFGAQMTLRDLLNADKGRGPSAASPAARGVQEANIAPRGPRVRADEAATLPAAGAADIPGLIMQGMEQGAERVPAGRGAGAAFVGAGLPRAMTGAKLLREHPSISPERRQMLKEMEDYISGLNKERIEPTFAEGGKAKPLVGIAPALRGAARAEARLAAKKAAEDAAKAARTPTEKAVVEKFGQKQEQEAARAKKVEQLSAEAPQREVKPAGRRVKVQPDVYRKMAEQQGDEAVLRAARAGEHLKPTPQGYVGAPRTVTNPQALGGMRRAMDKDFADAVEAVRLADPERLGTWYDRAKMGIAETSEPYQLPRVLEQHGVYSAGVSPESELGFSLKHLNTRAMGEPGMAYRGAPMRNLDEAVEQDRAAKMGFKIGEYMNKNDPRVPNAGLFGVNDFRRAQGMGYTDPAGNPWKAGVSETMHPFMDLETALQVDRANRGAVGGRTDWAGPHIQEVPWVYGKAQDLYSRGKSGRFGGDELEGIKRSLVEANNTARDYMYKHAASATHEAVPGASLGHVRQVLDMTPEQKAAYGATGRWDLPAPETAMSDMPGVGAGPRDVMYGALGLRQLPSRQASGLYINSLGGVETNPMTIARPLMDFPTGGGGGLMAPLSRRTMDAVEGLRALVDAQEAGAFNLPNTMPSIKDKNSLVLDSRSRNPDKLADPSAGVLPTSEQLAKMNDIMSGTGFGVSATNRGAVVFPYDPTMSAKEAAKVLKSKQAQLTAVFPSTPERSLTTMGYVPGVGKRSSEGPLPTAPYSGEATIDKLLMMADLPQEVARSLGESEAIRAQIREKALRDAKLGGTRGDIQETRRFFSEADWPKAVEMIRKGMTPAAALAALGYSASSMAGQER